MSKKSSIDYSELMGLMTALSRASLDSTTPSEVLIWLKARIEYLTKK